MRPSGGGQILRPGGTGIKTIITDQDRITIKAPGIHLLVEINGYLGIPANLVAIIRRNRRLYIWPGTTARIQSTADPARHKPARNAINISRTATTQSP
ncbi:MAG TPA: hypothetical protein VJB62_00125, partial [Patescibacteria group bacterium]|nr:hypothetical protein [Patescibacteria group bacterium]